MSFTNKRWPATFNKYWAVLVERDFSSQTENNLKLDTSCKGCVK